ALCGLTLRGIDVVDRAWRASAPVSAAVLLSCAVVSLVPSATLTAAVQSAVAIGAGVVTAAVGLTLVASGIRGNQPLLRPAGLALLTLSAQPSPVGNAFGLAAIVMLLITAGHLVVRALRAVWHEQADSQSRLQAAEHAMAYSAVRDHEMRNLVAGLSGAVTVLTTTEIAGDPLDRSQLGVAARVELERLRRMLESESIGLGTSSVAVAPLLSDLAALHGAAGADIELNVTDDLRALIPPECLAHIVTNLLVNCARHAPDAPVWLTAGRRADRVLIKVTDGGPGLPPGLSTELLEPGARGPSSTGTGLGLHVSAELAGRHGGKVHLVATPAGGRGCTVVVDLPAAAAGSRLLAQVAV
ncbi:MAG: sensor histidine kinase, partial [Actinomycetes bacterium]